MNREQINEIIDILQGSAAQPWDRMPDLELYMDQVVTYLKRQLTDLVDPPSGNLITPSVVNNYVKAGIVPRPVKKKYGKPQLSALTMACLLKGVLPSTHLKALVMPNGAEPGEGFHAEFAGIMNEVVGEESSRLSQMAGDDEIDADAVRRIAMHFAMRANIDRYIADRLIESLSD